MKDPKRFKGTVRLVNRKLRLVEVLGPEPPGSCRPSNRDLFYAPYGPDPARQVGHCFAADVASLGSS